MVGRSHYCFLGSQLVRGNLYSTPVVRLRIQMTETKTMTKLMHNVLGLVVEWI